MKTVTIVWLLHTPFNKLYPVIIGSKEHRDLMKTGYYEEVRIASV